MPLAKDITGGKYNRLTPIKFSHKKGYWHYWLFRCDCGKQIIALKGNVTRGTTKSCGCLRIEVTRQRSLKHGMRRTRIYSTWRNMFTRIENPNTHNFSSYGGRGIIVYERWYKFENFRDDMYESYLAHVKKFGERNTTLERKDVDKDYCKENCTWATNKEQANNTRRNKIFCLDNRCQTLTQWAEEYHIHWFTLHGRLFRMQWPLEKALTTPVKYRLLQS